MRKLNSLIPILTLIAIVLVSFSASCDRRNPPPILPPVAPPPDPSELRFIHKIVATPDTIYADNNITFSTVSVEIRDGENFGVPGQLVQFKASPIGRVLTNVRTDSTGVAKTTFWDDGESGVATITAIVRKFHDTVEDSLVSSDALDTTIYVEETPQVTSVTLHFDNLADPYPMRVGETTPIYATAVTSMDTNVPDGTLIAFECIKGKFVDSSGNDLGKNISQQTYNGRASVFYNSGTSATTNPESLPEYVTAKISTQSDTRGILIRPGVPFGIEIKSLVNVDGVDVPADTSHVGSQNQIFMETTLTDMYNNTCQNQTVKFTTDLGSFLNTTQVVSIPTNDFGVARVRFTPGLFAGAATIQASALNDTLRTQLIFTINSDDIHSMDFTQQGQINLNVANTGGTQSAVLRVKLRDINGNLIDRPQQVFFRIMNNPASMPEGANLNNNAPFDSVGVISNGGEAQVSVNAGTESGVLVIRASCTTDDGRYIQATKPNILINSGPAHTIATYMSGFNTGTNLGGGVWQVVAGAHVHDVYGNPVQKDTSVQFAIYGPNAGPGYNPPTNAQIQSEATVGNVSVNGDSTSGMAYTFVTYNGIMTNDVVTLYAASFDGYGNIVENYTSVKLPLNDPRFEIQVIPSFVNFGHTAPANKTADIIMTLTDGQGLDITGSEILLYSSRGQIILHPDHYNSPTNPTYNQVPPNYADINLPHYVTTYQRWAYGRIIVYLDEFTYGDAQTNTPSTTDVGITGRLMGTEIDNTSPLIVYRYAGDPPF
ncbi:MAG: hypothetical protein PHR59_05955 [Candidatus Cloacimonetes bacterium]|nr:hypothetical protein [Candidatus Cloacimonadota bacterium]